MTLQYAAIWYNSKNMAGVLKPFCIHCAQIVNIQKTKIILSEHSGRYLGRIRELSRHFAIIVSKSLSFKRSRSSLFKHTRRYPGRFPKHNDAYCIHTAPMVSIQNQNHTWKNTPEDALEDSQKMMGDLKTFCNRRALWLASKRPRSSLSKDSWSYLEVSTKNDDGPWTHNALKPRI